MILEDLLQSFLSLARSELNPTYVSISSKLFWMFKTWVCARITAWDGVTGHFACGGPSQRKARQNSGRVTVALEDSPSRATLHL